MRMSTDVVMILASESLDKDPTATHLSSNVVVLLSLILPGAKA